MLPGFRFLLAAIALSVSILIFGLGAAALLRAAHEEFASIPARRVTPEVVFAQQPVETAAPTLALLRVESPPQDSAPPASSAPMRESEPAPDAVPVPKVETEKLAALQADDAAAAEEPKPDIAKLDIAKLDFAKPEIVTSAAPASEPSVAEPAAEVRVAARDAAPAPVEAAPPAQVEATPVPAELIATPAMSDGASRANKKPATKTAALGSASQAVEDQAQAKKAAAKADRSEIRKKQRAERAKERRRLAARRARLAAQQAAATAAQQPDLFPVQTQPVQPTVTKRNR